MSAGRSFAWAGWYERVEGVVDVVFGPGHVIFYGPGQRVLRAVRNEAIDDLRETTGEPGRCPDCVWVRDPSINRPDQVVLGNPCARHRGSS